MNLEKLAAALLAFALVVAACGDSDEDAVTSTASTADAPTDTSTTAAIEVGPLSVHGCLVATDLVWVAALRDVDSVANELANVGTTATILDATTAAARPGLTGLLPADPDIILSGSYGRYLVLDPPLAPGQVLATIDYVNSTVDETVHPVYGAAFGVHWGLEPGHETYKETESGPTIESDTADGSTVGIVDSGFPAGITDPDDNEFMKDVANGVEHEDDDRPSHGTFVTSMVKQLAPATTVYGAKAGFGGSGYDDGTPIPVSTDHVTDELAVAFALQNLVERIVSDELNGPVYLNLSLGTYACPTPNGEEIPPPTAVGVLLKALATPHKVPVNKALDASGLADWPGATIVAAGGNEDLTANDNTAFYPAAWDEVMGVAALDAQGRAVVWSGPAERVFDDGMGWDPSNRVWAPLSNAKIGIDLLGIADAKPGTWSGSSFATAVATGMLAGKYVDPTHTCPEGLLYADEDGKLQPCP